jgi:molecular chaperone GrpE
MNKKTKKAEVEEPEVQTEVSTEEVVSEEVAPEVVEEIDFQDKYLRLYAEFDNFRKRTMRERADLITSASSQVLSQMIPLIDDFDRAEANPTEDIEAMREGMKLIQTKLLSTLTSKGLKPMAVQSGDKFNVDFHEAITNIPAPTKKLVGKVVDVVEKGYTLGDKVLRYAKVVIGQ